VWFEGPGGRGQETEGLSHQPGGVTLTRRAATSVLSALALLAILASPAQAAPGDLDPSFGVGGLVRTDVTPKNDSAIGMAVQGDGKIVVVGTGGAANSKFVVARYNATDGSLDNTFGTGGEVVTDISPFNDVASSVAIQGDGKIVVAGGVATNGPDPKFGVVRYDAVGALDAAFGGGDGIVTINVSKKFDTATGVGLQSGGRILVSGGAARDGVNPDFAVVGLLTNGNLDNAFGNGGIVRTDFNKGSYDWATGGLIVQPDDKIVLGGYTINRSHPRNELKAMARYTSNGRLDTTFSGDGKWSVDFGPPPFDRIWGMTLEGTSILAVGQVVNGISGGTTPSAALIRVTADGSLDSTFGHFGHVLSQGYRKAATVAIDGTGNIVTAGSKIRGFREFPLFGIARYHSDGSLDWVVFNDFGSYGDIANSVAIQSDGKIVAAGQTDFGSGNSKFAIARYLST
jgi:uncharacterized delta-60 repeat protein